MPFPSSNSLPHIRPEFRKGIARHSSQGAEYAPHQRIARTVRAFHPPGIGKKIIADVADVSRISRVKCPIAVWRHERRRDHVLHARSNAPARRGKVSWIFAP